MPGARNVKGLLRKKINKKALANVKEIYKKAPYQELLGSIVENNTDGIEDENHIDLEDSIDQVISADLDFSLDIKNINASWLIQKREIAQMLLPAVLKAYAIADGVNAVNDIMSDELKLGDDGIDVREVQTQLNKLLKIEIISILVEKVLENTNPEYKKTILERVVAREYPSKDNTSSNTSNRNDMALKSLKNMVNEKTNEILAVETDPNPFPSIPKNVGVIKKEATRIF